MLPKKISTRQARPKQISITYTTFVKAALVLIGLLFLWLVRDVVAIVLVALLLAALIDPMARWFEDRHIPRGFAVIIVYIVLVLVVGLMIFIFIPVVADQFSQMVAGIADLITGTINSVGELQNFVASYGLEADFSEALPTTQDVLGGGIYSFFSTIGGIINGLIAGFVILVLTYYMIVEEDSAKHFFQHLAPNKYQVRLAQIVTQTQQKVGAWMRGQIILALIVGLAVYIGLSVLGIKYALALAIIAALFEIVPYVGPIAAAIPAAIIAFAQSPIKGVFVLILYFVIQQLEAGLLTPKIMQKVVGLNPIVSIVALLIGIQLGGVVGAILAIPVTTMIAVILDDIFVHSS